MLLFVLAFLGGVLTILSPCILPVLPFVFARAGAPFRRSGLPMLVAMAATFAVVGSLAAVGGGWVVRANQYGRYLALAAMFVLGLALLYPPWAARLMRPVVAVGNRVAAAAGAEGSLRSSLIIGVATGMLWAPCAGPILGLILTGAAIRGASAETGLLLLAYAAGSALSLAAALALGGAVAAALRRSRRAEEWIRRSLGAAVVAGTLAIAFGLDTGALARISTASTTRVEQWLLARVSSEARTPSADREPALAGTAMQSAGRGLPVDAAKTSHGLAMTSTPMPAERPEAMAGGRAMGGGAMVTARDSVASPPIQATMPPLDGATAWLNSAPLTREDLRGRVVLVDFWTYSCINCIRALPYVEAWYEKYRDRGFTVIGIHAPEFAFEKDLRNVRRAVANLGIAYPVALDNDFVLWRAFANTYWPAHYFVDATGAIRHAHFGEGDYARSERVIQELLAESGVPGARDEVVARRGEGAALESDPRRVLSPETYIGHARAERFASPGGLSGKGAHVYTLPPELGMNEWALAGDWTIGAEAGVLNAAPGKIAFRFHARDLHLVLGPGPDGRPIRFHVLLDGAPPGEDHGVDVGADGAGTVGEYGLYQLIRQSGAARDRTFEIDFEDAAVAAYAFTFG